MVESKDDRFPDIAASLAPMVTSSPSKGGGLFSCFGPKEVDEPNSQDSSGPGHLALLSDTDSLQVFDPMLSTVRLGQSSSDTLCVYAF